MDDDPADSNRLEVFLATGRYPTQDVATCFFHPPRRSIDAARKGQQLASVSNCEFRVRSNLV